MIGRRAGRRRAAIPAQNAATWVSDAAGSVATSSSISRKARAIRKMSTGIAAAKELADFIQPMDEIVAEEDRKERGK